MLPAASHHLGPRTAQGSHSTQDHVQLSGSLRSPQASRCWGPPDIRTSPQLRAELGEAVHARSASALPRRCLWPGTGRSCHLPQPPPGDARLPLPAPELPATQLDLPGRAAASPSSEAPRPVRLTIPAPGGPRGGPGAPCGHILTQGLPLPRWVGGLGQAMPCMEAPESWAQLPALQPGDTARRASSAKPGPGPGSPPPILAFSACQQP